MIQANECRNTGCANLVFPGLEASGGLCLGCFEKSGSLDKTVRTVDPFHELNDPIDVIEAMHQPREFDPLVRYLPYKEGMDRVYQRLDRDHEVRLMGKVISSLGRDTEKAEERAAALACFTDAPLQQLLDAFLDRNRFIPSVLFRAAGKRVYRECRERVHWDERLRRSLLLALAWIPLEVIPPLFGELYASSPEWSRETGMNLRRYAWAAGWEWTYDEQHRPLFSSTCLPLTTSPESDVLPVAAPMDLNCGFCDRRLTRVLQIDCEQLELEGFRGVISSVTCDGCGFYGPIYTEWDEAGSIRWSMHNQCWSPPDEVVGNKAFSRGLTLNVGPPAVARRAVIPLFPVSRSQIGGMPTWLSRPAYPSCPSCDETMMFLAQLDAALLFPERAGLFQCFVCGDCNMSATVYQKS